MEELSVKQIYVIVDEQPDSFGIDKKFGAVLHKMEKEGRMFYLLFHYALRGLTADKAETAIKEANGNNRKLNDLLEKCLFDLYSPRDRMQKQIKEMSEKVDHAVTEARTISDRYMNELRSDLDNNRAVIEGQKQIISDLKEKLKQCEREKKQALQNRSATAKTEPKHSFFHNEKKIEKREKEDRERQSRQFIEEYIKSGKYTMEQVRFLTECLNEGIPVNDFKYFCEPNMDISTMEEMKNYYYGKK